MQIFNLTFADGKRCTCLIPDPLDSDEANAKDLGGIFQPGYMISAERVIPKPPTKLPWKAVRKGAWSLGQFVLERIDGGKFRCSWPGGEAVGGKDEISNAVRLNWSFGV